MHQHKAMTVKAGLLAVLGFATLSGCGSTLYAMEVSSAAAKLEAAEVIEAERFAPYEYYFAREHLIKAQEEAARADYSDAITFAEVASTYAEKALVAARKAHGGAQ